jgi:hypothetical protein
VPELLSSIADLAWPAVVLLGLVLFARPLAGLLRSGSDREEVTIEVGGQRVTLGKFRQQQNEVALDLQRQAPAGGRWAAGTRLGSSGRPRCCGSTTDRRTTRCSSTS